MCKLLRNDNFKRCVLMVLTIQLVFAMTMMSFASGGGVLGCDCNYGFWSNRGSLKARDICNYYNNYSRRSYSFLV